MAVRYRSLEFFSLEGERYKIEISDTTFSGTVFEFETAPPGFSIDWRGENQERHNPILASTCTVVMYATNPTLRNFKDYLAEGDESRFTMAVYRYNSGWTLFWSGNVQAEVSDVEDYQYPALEITAADGLAALKDVEYLNAGALYTGHARLSDIVANCLKKINHVTQFYTSADPFLVTSINAYEAQHTYSAAYDPLYYTSVDQDAFYTYDTNGGYEAMNCFDVLAEICKIMMGRLLYTEGKWHIEGIETRAFNASSYWRKYPYAMGAPAAYTEDNDLGGNPTRPRLKGATYGYKAPLKCVKVTQHIGALRNLIKNDTFNSDAAGPYTHNIFYDGTNSTLQLTGEIEWSLTNDAIASGIGGLAYIHFLVFQIYLKVGTKYLKRTIQITANGVVANPHQWVNGPAGTRFKLTTKSIYPIPAIGEETHDVTPFNYIIGVDPALTGQQTTIIDIEFDGLYRSTGALVDPADYTFSWIVNDPYLTVGAEPTNKADKIKPKDKITYTAENNTGGNTECLEMEVILGDAEDLNPAGALRFYNGSVYSATADWEMRSIAGTTKIAQLLANRVLAGQTTAIKTLDATAIGASVWKFAHTLRTEDDNQWQLQGGTFDASRDEFRGEWYDLVYSEEVPIVTVPPYDPGEYGLVRPPGASLDTYATTGQAVSAGMQGAMAVNSMAFTYTNEALAEGAVTDFDVTPAIGANLKIGDEIIVVNPMTLYPVTFTVTTASLDADTNIAATGTIPEGGFPAQSPVIYGQQNLLGQGAGATGTVTNFSAGDLSPLFTTSEATTTTTPALSFSLSNAAANTYFGNATGAPAAPSYTAAGALTKVDDTNVTLTLGGAPTTALLTAASLTLGWTGTLAIARGGTGLSALGTPLQQLRVNAGGTALEYFTDAGSSGTVTSVGLSLPTAIFDVSGSPVTTSGTLTATLDNQSANTVFAGPTTGGATTPTFRALVAADIPAGAGLTATNGLTLTGSTLKWGGTLTEDTTITQSGFRIRFTGHYTGIHKGTNNPTPRAVLDVDGLAVAAPTAVATPAEDAIANFHGTSGGTQVDTQLRVGAYSTATNGNWLQASSITAYDTQRPLRLQPLGGKTAIGKFGATPPTAYCTIFGSSLGTSGLSASTLHVAQTGESSTSSRISLGTNDTLSCLWQYDGTAQVNRLHTHVSGTTVTRRWSFGNTEFSDVMVLQPSAATTLCRLGVGYSATTSMHSTLQSAGSFSAAILATSGAPTFDETKHTVVYTASTNVTWTLPAANTCTGRVYWLNHAGSGGTITLSSSVSVGNGVTFSTLAAGEWARIQADIGSWRGKKW